MSDVTAPLPYSWVSLAGQFDKGQDEITFQGYTFKPEALKEEGRSGTAAEVKPLPSPIESQAGVGRAVSNQRITDGTVSVDIEFENLDFITTAEVILHYDPVIDEMLTVGLGANGVLLNVRHWHREKTDAQSRQQTGFSDDDRPHWTLLRSAGDRKTLQAQQKYHLEMIVQGSSLTVTLDGVEIGSGPLPFQLSGKQIGVFCQSQWNIHFRHLRVVPARPLAFVVMQFNPPEYEELFNDVIVPVCNQMGLEAFRSSQTYYPGLVIADIQRQIRESRVIIAEITPVNPNVYYEVGYADAIGKPVILIADGGKLDQLPFDVRAFRTLFYENSIGGKKKVEKTLTEFLRNIMNQKS